MVGTTISHYKILEKIGQGGMGEVFLAQDASLDRKVALKFLPEDLREDPVAHKRFLREAKSAAALDHPYICKIYEVGEAEEKSFLSMEYLEGETLKDKLARGPLPFKEALKTAVELAEAVEKAHGKGIVHRDLKPSNVMLTPEGHVKVMDFGLAKRLLPTDAGSQEQTTSTSLTGSGTTLGTLAYMSPEQLRGQQVDTRSDIFSFGVVLYEMLTGVHPFKKAQSVETSTAILNEVPPPLSRYLNEVPAVLQHTVRKMLAKKPDRRYQSIREVRTDVDELLEHEDYPAQAGEVGASQVGAETYPASRLMSWRGSFIVAIILGLAVLSYFAWRGTTSDQPSSGLPKPTHRQITFVGNASFPAISPDGQFIAYLAGEPEQTKVMVQDIAGGQDLEVFEDRGFFGGLRWAPGGSGLLVSLSSETKSGIFLIPRLGGSTRRVANVHNSLSCSPDGSQIARIRTGSKKIVLTDKRTGETTFIPLKGSFTFLGDVDWSPKGSWLAFHTTNDQERHVLWTVSRDGGQQEKVLEVFDTLSSARWSPQGDGIYYFRGKRRIKELWKIPVSASTGKPTGSPSLLLTGLEAGPYFTVSRNGSRLLYTREPGYSNLWLAILESSEKNPTVTTEQLTRGTSWDVDPSISPDGTRIAFSRSHGQTSNIFVVPIEGGTPQQVTFFNSINSHPVWSPDGQEIAFGSSEGGRYTVWKVRAAGGTPHQFVQSHLSGTSMLSWAPGRDLLYPRPGNRNFHLLDPVTEEERPLARDDSVGWMFYPVYSPDGDRVAVLRNRKPGVGRSLWIISVEDSSEVLLKKLEKRMIIPIGWSLDGQWIYGIDPGLKAPGAKLIAVPVSSGQRETLVTLPSDTSFSDSNMSSDGRHIVYAAAETQSDVWLVENFDPVVGASTSP